jgi:hypothetical protein
MAAALAGGDEPCGEPYALPPLAPEALDRLLAAVWQRLCRDLLMGARQPQKWWLREVRPPGELAYDYLWTGDFEWLVRISDLPLPADEVRATLIRRCPNDTWRRRRAPRPLVAGRGQAR